MTARTQDEILARFREAQNDTADLFGWKREALLEGMTAESIVTATDIAPATARTIAVAPDRLEGRAREYLEFAIGKITGHRGISAGRSVDKLRVYAWLLGRDDVVAAMDAAEYAQYGAPQVRAFADGMGWPFLDAAAEHELAWLERMSQGLPCSDGCMDGCDR